MIPAAATSRTEDDADLGLMARGYSHSHTTGIGQKSPDATLGDEALAILVDP